MTTIQACGDGNRLTETFGGWLRDPGEHYDHGPRFFLGGAVFYLGEGVGQP